MLNWQRPSGSVALRHTLKGALKTLDYKVFPQ